MTVPSKIRNFCMIAHLDLVAASFISLSSA